MKVLRLKNNNPNLPVEIWDNEDGSVSIPGNQRGIKLDREMTDYFTDNSEWQWSKLINWLKVHYEEVK